MPEGSLIDEPLRAWPRMLSGLGLFVDPADRTVTPDRVLAFAPDWPLWSGGSDKARHLAVPIGEVIDDSGAAWRFPEGTLLFKTFAYGDVPMETRVMRLRGGAWEYEVYRWNAAGDNGERLDLELPEEVQRPDGLVHTIPARLECETCHETPEDAVLGFVPQQLTGQRDFGEVFAAAPTRPPPIAEPVVGYWYGNCVHCHAGGEHENASFDLRPPVALANTIGQPTASSAASVGIRIEPGQPEESILFLAVSGEHDDPELADMPPLGIDVRDADAIETLRAFIEELSP